ncbi:MAG: hypothetical protein ACYC91_12740 [Solirubrobacteraceae bacterium]
MDLIAAGTSFCTAGSAFAVLAAAAPEEAVELELVGPPDPLDDAEDEELLLPQPANARALSAGNSTATRLLRVLTLNSFTLVDTPQKGGA